MYAGQPQAQRTSWQFPGMRSRSFFQPKVALISSFTVSAWFSGYKEICANAYDVFHHSRSNEQVSTSALFRLISTDLHRRARLFSALKRGFQTCSEDPSSILGLLTIAAVNLIWLGFLIRLWISRGRQCNSSL